MARAGLGKAVVRRLAELRQQLASDLATSWDGIAPRPFDFDGDTFRKPGGILWAGSRICS